MSKKSMMLIAVVALGALSVVRRSASYRSRRRSDYEETPGPAFLSVVNCCSAPAAWKGVRSRGCQAWDVLFSGKAKCNNCHVEPLWAEPGWNQHTPEEVCTDDFQANRAPDHRYRTAPLAGIFTHKKGGFYHDGRFATLSQVVNHYDSCFSLGLSEEEKHDLMQYLLSL